MGWNTAGKLVGDEGRMDTNKHMKIVDDHLLPSLEESGVCDDEYIFQ